MHLTAYTPTAGDFEEFFRICFHRDRCNAELRAAVEHEWRVFLKNPTTRTVAVADLEREPGSRLVGCAQVVFVSEAFLHRAKEEDAPCVTRRAAQRMPDGASPLLTLEEVRHANAGDGLNVLTTRWGRADALLDADEQRRVDRFMDRAFRTALCGYQIRENLMPTIGASALRRGLAAGYHLRRDYADYFRRHPPLPPAEQRPYLLGITRDEAFIGEGSLISHYFVFVPPRLSLKPGHKEFLRLVLEGHTDEEIADALCVSVPGVKNWWQAVFRHVAAVDAKQFPDFGDAAGASGSAPDKRGKEKRSRLLQYLREHPEELGPG